MNDGAWGYLVSETQFATDLVLAGSRKLCSVPDREYWNLGYDQIYPLHVGMLSYASGLERLCKLVIACRGYLLNDSFPSLRHYNHRIVDLLSDVDSFDYSVLRTVDLSDVSEIPVYNDAFVEFINYFASGSGRYEHLDSLSDPAGSATAYSDWVALCSRTSLSSDISGLITLQEAVSRAVLTACCDAELETSAMGLLGLHGQEYFAASVGVVLELYTIVRRVASLLGALTNYTGKAFPILNEIVYKLKLGEAEFFEYEVLGIRDQGVVAEELRDYFRTAPVEEAGD